MTSYYSLRKQKSVDTDPQMGILQDNLQTEADDRIISDMSLLSPQVSKITHLPSYSERGEAYTHKHTPHPKVSRHANLPCCTEVSDSITNVSTPHQMASRTTDKSMPSTSHKTPNKVTKKKGMLKAKVPKGTFAKKDTPNKFVNRKDRTPVVLPAHSVDLYEVAPYPYHDSMMDEASTPPPQVAKQQPGQGESAAASSPQAGTSTSCPSGNKEWLRIPSKQTNLEQLLDLASLLSTEVDRKLQDEEVEEVVFKERPDRQFATKLQKLTELMLAGNASSDVSPPPGVADVTRIMDDTYEMSLNNVLKSPRLTNGQCNVVTHPIMSPKAIDLQLLRERNQALTDLTTNQRRELNLKAKEFRDAMDNRDMKIYQLSQDRNYLQSVLGPAKYNLNPYGMGHDSHPGLLLGNTNKNANSGRAGCKRVRKSVACNLCETPLSDPSADEESTDGESVESDRSDSFESDHSNSYESDTEEEVLSESPKPSSMLIKSLEDLATQLGKRTQEKAPKADAKYFAKPRQFNSEDEPWKDFVGHFMSCAKANKWPEATWGMYLGTLLAGSAYKAYAQIKEEDLIDWNKVHKYIESQLGDYKSFYRSKLKTHVFDFSTDFQQEVLKMSHEAQTAFPFKEEEIWHEAVKSRFIMGLPAEISDKLHGIYRSTDKTPLQLAQAAEDIKNDLLERRQVQVYPPAPVPQPVMAVRNVIPQATEQQYAAKRNFDGMAQPTPADKIFMKNKECHRCHLKGHLKRFCRVDLSKLKQTTEDNKNDNKIRRVDNKATVTPPVDYAAIVASVLSKMQQGNSKQ